MHIKTIYLHTIGRISGIGIEVKYPVKFCGTGHRVGGVSNRMTSQRFHFSETTGIFMPAMVQLILISILPPVICLPRDLVNHNNYYSCYMYT